LCIPSSLAIGERTGEQGFEVGQERLYVARNQASAGSDIDLLVLLSEPFDHFDELCRIIDLLYPVQLESEQLISAKPAAVDEFEFGRLQLYRNAKREGLFLC